LIASHCESKMLSPNPRNLPQMSSSKFIFFNADFDPCGQRGWITLLEKKVGFKYVEINCFNKDLEMTKLFREVSPSGTVPAGIHYGKNLNESIPFCKYLDEMFPENSLFPGSPYSRWEAHALVHKINDNFVPTFYKTLTEQNAVRRQEHQQHLLSLIREFNEQLAKSGGLWLMGNQFTLVDIALLPFCERIKVVLPYFNNFKVPTTEEYRLFNEWMERGFQRESFRITSADRSEQSMRVQPFKSRKRVEYLREINQFYAFNQMEKVKGLLANSIGPESAVELRIISKESMQLRPPSASTVKPV